VKVNHKITVRKGVEGGIDGAASAAAVVAAWQIGRWTGADMPDDIKSYLVLVVSALVTGAIRACRNWFKTKKRA